MHSRSTQVNVNSLLTSIKGAASCITHLPKPILLQTYFTQQQQQASNDDVQPHHSPAMGLHSWHAARSSPAPAAYGLADCNFGQVRELAQTQHLM